MQAALKEQLYELWMRGSSRSLYYAAAGVVAAVVLWFGLGLVIPTPRESDAQAVRLARLLDLTRFYLALALLAAAAFFGGQYLHRRRITHERLELLESGRPVMGRIAAKGPGCELEYSFTDDRGQTHRGRIEIAPRWMERWVVGQEVLIVVDPRQPARHLADLFGFRATDYAKLKAKRG